MTRFIIKALRDNKGMSLITSMIAVGTVGVIGMTISRSVDDAQKVGSKNQAFGDKRIISDMISKRVSCSLSFDGYNFPYKCQNQKMDLRDYEGKIIVGKSGTKIGNWTVKAVCSKKKDMIDVKMARINADGKYLKDPLTGQVLDFRHPTSSTFTQEDSPCRGYLDGDAFEGRIESIVKHDLTFKEVEVEGIDDEETVKPYEYKTKGTRLRVSAQLMSAALGRNHTTRIYMRITEGQKKVIFPEDGDWQEIHRVSGYKDDRHAYDRGFYQTFVKVTPKKMHRFLFKIAGDGGESGTHVGILESPIEISIEDMR